MHAHTRMCVCVKRPRSARYDRVRWVIPRRAQAFNDDICFLVANNDGKGNSANVSIQIWNSNDQARNIGVSLLRQ